MIGSGIRNHFPLLRTLSVLLGFLILIGWGLGSAGKNYSASALDSDNWSWAPAHSFRDSSPPQGVWLPYSSRPGNLEQNGSFWLRIPLDPSAVRDPHLLIFNTVALSVFDGNRLLFSYDPNQRNHRLNLFYHWNLAPMPTPIPSEVYMLLDNRGSLRPVPSVQLIGRGDLFAQLIQKDTYAFMLSGLFLFSLFVALGLYFIRQDNLHLYFALLAFCGCYASLARNYLLQVIWDQPWVSFIEHVIFPLGVYGFVNIMINVFSAEHTHILRKIRWVVLSFAIVTLICAIFLDIIWFGWLLSYPVLTMFLVTAGVVFHSIWSAYQDRQGTESIWMMAGFFIVATFALIHVLRTYLPKLYDWLEHNIPLLFKLPFDILSISLFLFLICLIRIIVYRFGLLNKQLTTFNLSLETNVRRRTEELRERETQLQEANLQLASTMRGTAEAIASSMVLEERHRLTGTIHDTIGHSLTATIVQLEAAKRLLKRDPELALEKLNASQGLVRRGLEEIRNSVRLLRDDSSRYDLAAAISELIKETEQTTGVSIESRIAPLPDSLTTLQKRVLFQALQEGLTNGLRHGGSSCFQFTLTSDDSVLRFRLVSDGRTYTPSAFGFGLKAMSERIANLGGIMAVAPGNPGCILTLSLPIRPLELSEGANRG
ncbi:sensor histidine kinase [Cohnella cholangitidis]|uniref:histidine kinase n=1 Tax=Cohnella cholangitidis TaxID=2598458 RepID=A0A7G5C167_9BACL|nr:sensor histidine kinase [Cohnella cholangitidis]QMV42951.1 sensor histidine kinase [Cohnella cholangitidis]